MFRVSYPVAPRVDPQEVIAKIAAVTLDSAPRLSRTLMTTLLLNCHSCHLIDDKPRRKDKSSAETT